MQERHTGLETPHNPLLHNLERNIIETRSRKAIALLQEGIGRHWAGLAFRDNESLPRG
jgi:hypothetical protein